MTDSVTSPRQEYNDLLIDVERNRDAVKGERAIKAKRATYLPPLASMMATYNIADDGSQTCTVGATLTPAGKVQYSKYLSLAYFYGASGRTVDGLSGLVFMKEPIQELPDEVEYLKSNADGRGFGLRKVSQDAVKEAFISPWSGVLVDFPQVRQQLTIADAERENLRPKILHYKFESIINWFFDIVDNQQKLVLLVLKEKQEKRDGFQIRSDNHQYRVLELIDGIYYQSLYNNAGELEVEPQQVIVNGAPATEIPFYWINVGAEDKSIINDLVDANLNHYRFFADYANKEHQSAFPIFYETGARDSSHNALIGPGVKWENQSSEASFGVLQTASDGGSMRQYLLDMESRMAALGAEMLKPRISGAESAEAKSLDQVAQNSTVGDVALNVSEALEKAIQYCAFWLGSAEEVIYQLNTDYNPSRMSGQDLTALVGAWQGGAISYETFYRNLQEGEIADPERTAEEEQDLIEDESMGAGMNNAAPPQAQAPVNDDSATTDPTNQ